jgi:hypothetical protein
MCFAYIHALASLGFETRSILTQTGEFSFSRTALRKLILPSSVEVISADCFSGCTSLELLEAETGLWLQ